MAGRLRALLVGICPALERESGYRSRPGLVSLTGFQTPAALRRIGAGRLTGWLARRKVRGAPGIAGRAVAAAHAQRTRLPGEARAARLVADLASQILELDGRITSAGDEITQVLAGDGHAQLIQSLRGMGPLLNAEFIAATGDLPGYRDAAQLAADAGIAPCPAAPGAAPATCAGLLATTGGCAASSTSPRLLPRRANRDVQTRRLAGLLPQEARAGGRSTARRSCAWPAAGPACCGRCCATGAATCKLRRCPAPLDWGHQDLPAGGHQ